MHVGRNLLRGLPGFEGPFDLTAHTRWNCGRMPSEPAKV